MTRTTLDERTSQMLFVAFELSKKKWTLAITDRNGVSVRTHTIPAGDFDKLAHHIANAKRKLDVDVNARVKACHEAGFDGFWIVRALAKHGVECVVLDAASIEVPRRKRRAKSDRLDAGKLLALLLRLERGEEAAKIVVVPSAEQEDERHQSRERTRISQDLTAATNRIKSLLRAQGAELAGRHKFDVKDLERVQIWNGKPLPPTLRAELTRLIELTQLHRTHLAAIDKQQKAELQRQAKEAKERAKNDGKPMHQTSEIECKLHQLRGIGILGAHQLAQEVFWRTFTNAKKVGSYTGLVPVPNLSGDGGHGESISKAGNSRLRALLTEQAWDWLIWQPESKLTLDFRRKYGERSGRLKRIGIVEMARKLAVALWKYVTFGDVPEGAVLRTSVVK